jgi:hypothetical protein
MKAIVQHEYGAPQDVLHLAEVTMPVIGAQDVLGGGSRGGTR